MAPNREERFLMRQRGAGTRQIQDFDFDLVLPGVASEPLEPQRSGRSRQTPKPELLPRRSSRAPLSTKKLPPQRSSRKTPATARKRASPRSTLPAGPNETQGGELPSSIRLQVDEDGIVRKRRRLNYIGEALENAVSPERQISAQVASPAHQGNVEEYPDANRTKKRKKRKSIGQVSRRRTKPAVAEAVPEVSTKPQDEGVPLQPTDYDQRKEEGLPEAQEQVQQKPAKGKRKLVKREPKKRKIVTSVADASEIHDTNSIAVVPDVQAAPEALSIAPKKPMIQRKKRKSIGVIVKKRNASYPQKAIGIGDSAPTTNAELELHAEPAAGSIRQTEHPTLSNSKDHYVGSLGADQEVSNDTSRPPGPRKKGRPRKSKMPKPTTMDAQTKTVRHKPTHSQLQNHSTTRASVEKDTTKENRITRSRKKDEDSVPITIQHLSHNLNILNDDDDDDFLGLIPFPKKIGVNAVDVLSQMCKELIEKTAETLAHGAKNETSEKRRSEWKRKARNVEVFGDELDDRLFHMAEVLDQKAALTTRLRKATKESKLLKSKLLSLQQDRNAIVLQTKQLQTRQSTMTKAAQTEDELNRMLHDLKRTVKRGRVLQESQEGRLEPERFSKGSLELLLRTAATDVSSGQGVGLLKKVKGFNEKLERWMSGNGERI